MTILKRQKLNKHNELNATQILRHFDHRVFGFQCPHLEPLPSINHPHLVNLTPLITSLATPTTQPLGQNLYPHLFFYPCPSSLTTFQCFSHQTQGNKLLPEPHPPPFMGYPSTTHGTLFSSCHTVASNPQGHHS